MAKVAMPVGLSNPASTGKQQAVDALNHFLTPQRSGCKTTSEPEAATGPAPSQLPCPSPELRTPYNVHGEDDALMALQELDAFLTPARGLMPRASSTMLSASARRHGAEQPQHSVADAPARSTHQSCRHGGNPVARLSSALTRAATHHGTLQHHCAASREQPKTVGSLLPKRILKRPSIASSHPPSEDAAPAGIPPAEDALRADSAEPVLASDHLSTVPAEMLPMPQQRKSTPYGALSGVQSSTAPFDNESSQALMQYVQRVQSDQICALDPSQGSKSEAPLALHSECEACSGDNSGSEAAEAAAIQQARPALSKVLQPATSLMDQTLLGCHLEHLLHKFSGLAPATGISALQVLPLLFGTLLSCTFCHQVLVECEE